MYHKLVVNFIQVIELEKIIARSMAYLRFCLFHPWIYRPRLFGLRKHMRGTLANVAYHHFSEECIFSLFGMLVIFLWPSVFSSHLRNFSMATKDLEPIQAAQL